MKKLLASLMVLAMCAPAMALTFSTSATDNVLTINYTLGSGEGLRGLALTVTNVSGDGYVAAGTDVVVAPFNTFIDWAADVDNTYAAVGDGHPVAMVTPDVVAGQYEVTFPAQSFALSMGYLDEGGNQAAITASGSIVITFSGTTDTEVAIALDTLRGGAVGDALTVDGAGLVNQTVTFGPTEVLVGTPVVAKTTAAPAAADKVNAGRVETFVASGVSGSEGGAVEYQFTWGDGNVGDWGAATQTHTYTYGGAGVVSTTGYSFNVTVEARLVADTTQAAVSAPLALTSEAVKSTAAFYAAWTSATWNRPNCWAYQRNCRGDVDGINQLSRPVYTNDLAKFKDAYNKLDSALVLVVDGVCADNNHASQLSRRVYTADLTEFKLYYNKNVSLVPVCDQTNFHYWTK